MGVEAGRDGPMDAVIAAARVVFHSLDERHADGWLTAIRDFTRQAGKLESKARRTVMGRECPLTRVSLIHRDVAGLSAHDLA